MRVGRRIPCLDKEKIAVVGAGVAGMTAAHDLARLGYQVTVFEELEVPGGQMATGVPIYRLSRELMNLEIAAICELGVDLKLGVSVGKDVTIPELREQGYKAFIIAAGYMQGRPLTIPGSDKKGVHIGINLLREVNLGKPYHGRREVRRHRRRQRRDGRCPHDCPYPRRGRAVQLRQAKKLCHDRYCPHSGAHGKVH